MTTTTQITTIDITVPTEWYGGFEADYDTDAVQAEYADAIDAAATALVPGVTVARNGMVYADIDVADAASEIDWAEVMDSIDLEPIARQHARTAE